MKKWFIAVCVVFTVACGFVSFNSTVSAEIKVSPKNLRLIILSIKQKDTGGTYNFDKTHAFIGFRVKHYGLIEVPGYFRDFNGVVNYDAKDPAKSSVEFSAKMTSVDTGVAKRDEHLRGAEFFEVEKYPEMTFKSTKIVKNGEQWTMTGDFTMKGVTKSVSFPFNVTGVIEQRNGMKMGLTAETSINRRDFGINYPNTAIADDIKVVLQIEANKAAPKPAAAPAE